MRTLTLYADRESTIPLNPIASIKTKNGLNAKFAITNSQTTLALPKAKLIQLNTENNHGASLRPTDIKTQYSVKNMEISVLLPAGLTITLFPVTTSATIAKEPNTKISTVKLTRLIIPPST